MYKNPVDALFDDFDRKLQSFGQNDNEAMREINIIMPLLSHPYGLGWDGMDLLLKKYYMGKYPDITILPYNIHLPKPVAIVEAKKKHKDVPSLKKHLDQLKGYQEMYQTTWGLLSDGEKWILQKDNKEFHAFDSILEMKSHIKDLQHCIGKRSIIERIVKHNTVDIFIGNYADKIFTVIDPFQSISDPVGLYEYLSQPTYGGAELIKNISETIESTRKGNKAFRLESLLIHSFRCNLASTVSQIMHLLINLEIEGHLGELNGNYYPVLKNWVNIYPSLIALLRGTESKIDSVPIMQLLSQSENLYNDFISDLDNLDDFSKSLISQFQSLQGQDSAFKGLL